MRRYEHGAETSESEYTWTEAVGGWQGTVGVLLGVGLVAFPAGSAFSPVLARWLPAAATAGGILTLGFVLWICALAWVFQAMLSATARAAGRTAGGGIVGTGLAKRRVRSVAPANAG